MRVELRSTVARKYTCLAVFALLALTISCSESPKSPAFVAQIPREAVSDKDAQTIAVDAYIYFYPLITMDITRRVSVNTDPLKKAGFGPAGEFHHIREYPPVTFREVVRPTFDTL